MASSSPPLSSMGVLLKLLRSILESPDVFNYTQYFNMLKDIPIFTKVMKKTYNTLELFSFGTITDYVLNPNDYLKLSSDAVSKLRTLTLVSLANSTEIIDLDALTIELRVGTKRETLDVLLDGCDLGGITTAIDFQRGRVQFFSSRKRNTDLMNVEHLVKVKAAVLELLANRSMVFICPICQFTDVITRIVLSTVKDKEESEKADAALLEFLKATALDDESMKAASEANGVKIDNSIELLMELNHAAAEMDNMMMDVGEEFGRAESIKFAEANMNLRNKLKELIKE